MQVTPVKSESQIYFDCGLLLPAGMQGYWITDLMYDAVIMD